MTITRLPRAENETRTRDPNLGKVVLYQLSYFRSCMASSAGGQAPFGSANIRAYSDSSKLFRQKISLSPPFSGAALRVGGSGSPNKPTRCRRNQAVPQQASRIPNSRCPAAVVRPTDRRIRKTSHSAVRLSTGRPSSATRNLVPRTSATVPQTNPMPMQSGNLTFRHNVAKSPPVLKRTLLQYITIPQSDSQQATGSPAN